MSEAEASPQPSHAPAAGPVAILAGGGLLPAEIAEALEQSGRAFHIIAIDGHADTVLGRWPASVVNIAEIGGMQAAIRRHRCRDIVIAGGLNRPDLASIRIDLGTVRHVASLLALMKGGDDTLLRKVVRFFEGQGLRVLGVADVAPRLLAPARALGRHQPAHPQWAAIARGAALIRDLSPYDVGQAVVATEQDVLAVEGADGTDAMLARLSPRAATAGAVLVKMPKLGQERRIDLPAVGPDTVRRAVAAGLSGVAVEAGGAVVLGREEAVRIADEAGLALIGFEPDRLPGPPSRASAGPHATAVPGRSTAAVPQGRRLPTPRDRSDARIGLDLIHLLARHRAGTAAVIVRRHVLAIGDESEALELVGRARRIRPWRGLLRRRTGLLALANGAAVPDAGPTAEVLTPALVEAVAGAGFSGIILAGGSARAEAVAAADRVGIVLLKPEDGDA